MLYNPGLMKPSAQGWIFELTPGAEDTFARGAFELTEVFTDPRIVVWRDLPERQNCYLDLPDPPNATRRLHIKRYKPAHALDVQTEVAAIRLLQRAGIPTVPLLAWGANAEEHSFLISADLWAHRPADQALGEGLAFARLAPAIARLAAALHRARLHHQDLYLCHFFVNPAVPDLDLHLIDPGRVGRYRYFKLRWIVKDLAQLLYSTRGCDLSAAQRGELLHCYFGAHPTSLQPLIRLLLPLKISAIARHDRRLQRRQPGRRVSIPPLQQPGRP